MKNARSIFLDFRRLLFVIIGWRLVLFLVGFLASVFIVNRAFPFPYADTILRDSGLPQFIWGFANFDGVHYLRTALWGYVSEYSQAFFPLYSLLMYVIGFWGWSFEPRLIYILSGLLISFFCFLIGSFFYLKVIEKDYFKEFALRSILLLISFPTSFFFMSVYTESLFFLLSVLSFYFILRKQFLYASIFIALATATKVIGIFLIVVLALEVFLSLKKIHREVHVFDLFKNILAIVFSSSGLLLYMFYLWIRFNNPVYFMTAQPIFGSERQVDTVVLLPQVIFRYLKMLISVPVHSTQFFAVSIEFLFTLFGLLLLIFSFKKVRFSFWLFSLGAFLLPTITGTLTSMPRYVLMLFMLFPALIHIINHKWKYVVTLCFILQIIFTFLFVGGYWIA